MVERLQKKAPFIAAALVIALLSWLVVSGFASSTDFHKSTLAELEEKQTTVLELSAASAAAALTRVVAALSRYAVMQFPLLVGFDLYSR